MNIELEDVDRLRHMLGVSERTPRGYRNYFAAGSNDQPSMARLEAAGLVVRNRNWDLTTWPVYHATLDGARLVGLQRLP